MALPEPENRIFRFFIREVVFMRLDAMDLALDPSQPLQRPAAVERALGSTSSLADALGVH
jgi:hypothetical protein